MGKILIEIRSLIIAPQIRLGETSWSGKKERELLKSLFHISSLQSSLLRYETLIGNDLLDASGWSRKSMKREKRHCNILTQTVVRLRST